MQPARLLLTIATALLAWCPAIAGGQVPGAAASQFETGHAAAQARSLNGDWEGARKAWLMLLRKHAGAAYARPWLPEIRESLRRAAFWSGRRRPDPKPLIEGQLLSYSKMTGKLRVAYEPSQLGDFDQLANYSLHPMHFTGSYSVEVEGTPQALSNIGVLVAIENDKGYLVQAGERYEDSKLFKQHVIARIAGSDQEVLEKLDPRERERRTKPERIKLKISVSKSSLRVSYDGRSIFSIKRSDQQLGQFGILGPANFDKITLDGVAGPAWIEDRVDALLQEELRAFELSYKDPDELAAWKTGVAVHKSSRKLGELASQLPFPEKVTRAQGQLVQHLRAMMKAGRYTDVVLELARCTSAECTPATREFLLVVNALAAEHYSLALEHIQALAKLATIAPQMRIVEALINARMERRPRSIELLRDIIAKQPGDPAMYAELAQQLLLEADLDGSREQIDAGLTIAPGDEDLHELRQQVAKASQGPSWKRAQQAAGEYFEVASDIDPRTTRIIAREADLAVQHYMRRFQALPRQHPKLKLYVFSGSTSYANYVAGVEAYSPENTLGLFSPRLKQVLLWNQADRPATLSVVRHEVMHSYADVVLGLVPMWFSEGVAEYFAVAKQPGGRWVEGADSAPHLLALEAHGLEQISLAQLLYLDQPAFMASSEYTYPMSWAFVDFLLNSTPANKQLFDELWRVLSGEIEPGTAVHQVFDGSDLDELNRDFWAAVEQRISAR